MYCTLSCLLSPQYGWFTARSIPSTYRIPWQKHWHFDIFSLPVSFLPETVLLYTVFSLSQRHRLSIIEHVSRYPNRTIALTRFLLLFLDVFAEMQRTSRLGSLKWIPLGDLHYSTYSMLSCCYHYRGENSFQAALQSANSICSWAGLCFLKLTLSLERGNLKPPRRHTPSTNFLHAPAASMNGDSSADGEWFC